MKELLENTLPYLGVRPIYSETDYKLPGTVTVAVPDVRGMEYAEMQKTFRAAGLGFDITGDGNTVTDQFPVPGELVNEKENILLWMP
jgi:stage V sporulation protein D (sporulation-specific penicillin-binding protein)